MVYFSKKQIGPGANTATKDGTNNFTGQNTFNNNTYFNENLWVLKDKFAYFGWDQNGAKLKVGGKPGGQDGYITALTGDLIVNENGHGRVNIKTDMVMDNHWIGNLHDPSNAQDAATKNYVDNRVKLIEKSGFSFTRQAINTSAGAQVYKYYGNMSYTNIGIGNNAQILSVYCKSIPSSGQHIVITFFGEYQTDNLLIEIYQYGSDTNITNDLNSAIFRIGYING